MEGIDFSDVKSLSLLVDGEQKEVVKIQHGDVVLWEKPSDINEDTNNDTTTL